ncbi:penicillin acylase family protein, partial [Nocardioides sp.]
MSLTRDRWGIPHIRAGSLLQVVHEQGRVTAADRAWQLEVERRRAEGTCAEVFGPAAREWDVLARRALLVDIARRAYARLTASTRDVVDAYVAGVNETLATARMPEEVPDLRPQPWHPWTPLAVFAVQHLLFSSFPSKLWRHHLAASAGEEWLDLFRLESLPGGSNAFVVDGSLTTSGLPVLAGDPHRVLEAPGCYAQVRLVCTDPDDPFDVAGLSFVGVPGIQHFGHAGSVAWGVTNAVADDEDVYDEQLARHAEGVVTLGGTGWEPVARREELLRVRTGADSFVAEPLEVLVTDRGPVVVGGPDDARAFSLRTPCYVLGDLGFEALPALLRARTAEDVTTAFGHWVGPVDNLLVADSGGHVEHRVVGRVPQRDPDRRAALQRLPGRGRDGHGWTGWVDDLPRRTGAVLVTANDRASREHDRV